MSTLVKSLNNDTLDAVAWRTLGTSDTLPDVIRQNPQISQVDPVLPPGTIVLVPDAPQQSSRIQHLTKLWS